MGKLKYTIIYDVRFDGGVIWENKEMIVKNSDDKIDAECKLSKYIRMKYEGVSSIRIIRCIGAEKEGGDFIDDILGSGCRGNQMDDLFSQFGNMFGSKKTPFS